MLKIIGHADGNFDPDFYRWVMVKKTYYLGYSKIDLKSSLLKRRKHSLGLF